jgi:DNA-binding CsgD family transcriptional regulator
MAGTRFEREGINCAIAQLFDQTRAGHGGALFIVGEPGLGKTTSLEHASALARVDHCVGLGFGEVMETSLPFGLLTQALEALGGRDVLLGDSPPGVGDGRAARFYAVWRWLEDLATAAPILLGLDDVHWADPDSLALLTFLCRRIGALPVAVVATLRPWPPAALEVCLGLAHDGLAGCQRLTPLSEQASVELLSARLGRAVDDRLANTAWQISAGNPLLLEQLAQAVGREEQLPAFDDGRAAVSTEGLLLTRFAGLPPAGLRAARAASVLGIRFRPELATVIAGLDEREAELALDALCRSGLVTPTGASVGHATVGFVHPLFRQALYDDLPPPVRARLHARAFATLCARGMDSEAAEHALRADLTGDPDAVAVLERVGRAALGAGALATAAEYLQAAVRLAGDRADPDLLLVLGEALLTGGRTGEAVTVYERLLARPEALITERGVALRMLGRAQFALGAYQAAATRFAQAAELTAESDSAQAIEALLDDALASWVTAGPARSLPLVVRARELGRDAAPALRRRTTVAWAYIALLAGDDSGVVASEAAVRELEADPLAQMSDLSWTWSTLLTYSHMAIVAERHIDAARVLPTALETAERIDAVEAIASLCVVSARFCHHVGRLQEALGYARRAAGLTEFVPMVSSYAGIAQVTLLYELGHTEESDAWFARIEPQAHARGEALALLILWTTRARRLFDEGQIIEACKVYARIEELCERAGIGHPCVWPWARHAITSYLANDRPEDAHRVIGWLESNTNRLSSRWPRIAAATGRAALTEAAGELEAAEAHYGVALSLHEEVELPLEYVETLLGYGAFLRRRGRLIQARAVLAEALGLAEGYGAGRLTGRARDELVVAGGRRHRARDALPVLTAQEARVARLAAAGLSNNDIAAQLHLSVRTVEYHLRQVYTKLGISSRRQLMTAAMRSSLSQPPNAPVADANGR